GTANVCGCAPTSCAAAGASCGALDDGCGGTLDCGICGAPLSCGGGGTANVCGAPPVSIGFCRLQFPDSAALGTGETVAVYGRVYVAGITDASSVNDPDPRILSQLGYGPDGTDPAMVGGWVWLDAAVNAGYDGAASGEPNNDEYWAELGAPEGIWDYAYRFSGDGGATWLYCDGLAPGSSDGYQPANAGSLDVTLVPPTISGIDYAVVAHGARITVSGSNLGGLVDLTIGGVSQSVELSSSTQVVILVSEGTPVGVGQPLVLTAEGGASAPFAVDVVHLVISELDADTAGTDTLEFVEIATGVPASLDLTGYQLVLLNGNTDLSYLSLALGTTRADGFFVIGNTATAPDLVVPSNSLQNGADAAAIVQDPVLIPNGSPVASLPPRIDALVYGTADADDPELLLELFGAGPEAVQLDEAARGSKDTHSSQRCSGARLDGRSFSISDPTPGAANTCAFAAAEVQALLSANCSGCHTGGGSSGGLALDDFPTTTYGVPSSELPSMSRIEPGSSATSYLWHKVAGTHASVGGSGSRMPMGAAPLSAIDIERLALFIEALP
ncbi:MAG: IPT/TIG domain-containing protein, partial [Myxococcales bacterium]|nr:IPT/TIG domain-containing protein [Myxococcales bacterium]